MAPTLLGYLIECDYPDHVAARLIRFSRVRVDREVVTEPGRIVPDRGVVEVLVNARTWQPVGPDLVA